MEGRKTSNVIKITAGQEHIILDNQSITDQESLMYPAFSAALDALNGIVQYSDFWNDREQKRRERGDGRKQNRFYGYSNNILAFCAPRGQGKTSAMLSFSRAIVWGDATQRKDKKLEEISKNHSFYDLPPIDPTMLNEDESVIQLVLGKLFHEISDLWEKPWDRDNFQDTASQKESKKFEILEDFKACYHGLHHINKQSGQERNIDDFEKMLTASDIFQLKERIHKIIMYFFRLLGYAPENSFLLIQLDDTDMQMKNAYSVLEEVRKYLAMPNVVVLMATHLDQLRILITQQYAAQLQSAYHDQSELNTETRHMAAKYLDKLIPASQAIYLPTMRLQRDIENKLMLVVKRPEGCSEPKELENEIFWMIYQKTGLAFIRHDNYMHNLLPTTLRGLQHLYRLLDQMESLEKPETVEFDNDFGRRKPQLQEYCGKMKVYLKGKYRNLLLFESYFLNDWCSSKMDASDWRLLKLIDKTASIRRLPYAVQSLNEKHEQEETEFISPPRFTWSLSAKEKSDISKVMETITSIEREKLKYHLPTIEDSKVEKENYFIQLILLLAEEAKQCITEKKYLFVFAVETYFSIQLNKLAVVDQITSIDNTLNRLEKNTPNESLFLYEFHQLIGHLYSDCDLPSRTKLNKWIAEFQSLREKLNDKSLCNSQERDHSKEILKYLLQLLCLENSSSQGPHISRQAINLQEYVVYIFCNLDVLAQVLKKSADFTSEDTESIEKYFQRLKKEIVTEKNTQAYPFSSTDTNTLYDTIKDFIIPKDKFAAAAEQVTATGNT